MWYTTVCVLALSYRCTNRLLHGRLWKASRTSIDTTSYLVLEGEHNGICEVGKFIKMGKCGCRRCHVASKSYSCVISSFIFDQAEM